ncbi:alpha-protein kinase 1 [Pleurodeles waltl]|uniref:alpha-protein kinase 1 n=1 Tax=Pleurodeles waltl TaxID=8319 RepID=UPI0037097646
MNNQDCVAILEECKQSLSLLPLEDPGPSEEEQAEYKLLGDLLPDDLRSLIEEAKGMKWPFVPERWQYKQEVGPEDKINLHDLINANLHQLLVYLKASIMAKEYATAAAIVFLTDRFLYWIDASRNLLRVAKGLHKRCPSTPIAPQVVIRQARVSVNTGKLLKAEYILSSLINNSGGTGSWIYAEESDRILVQSVCIQIRGQILQKLGLWYEAAELIWASIVGFFELTLPDRKGISSSLGILADIFVSMSEEDFQKFKSNSLIDLSLLTEYDHRLLSAAEACKLAATYSAYSPLFVLTNVNIRGMCLLSYSFSSDCLEERRKYYLSEAKEAFEVGLLTKKDTDSVSSKQQLHNLVKAAYCLATVHKWHSGETEELCSVRQLCGEAVEKLCVYSSLPEKQDKSALAKEITSLISTVTELLKVQSFTNSDERSYVPESYKDCAEKSILHGRVSFKEIIEMHSQHHTSVCKVFANIGKNHKTKEEPSANGICITALETATRNPDTVAMEEHGHRMKGASRHPPLQKYNRKHQNTVNKGKRPLTRSDPVTEDAETESESVPSGKSDSNRRSDQPPIRHQSSSSSHSWSNLSRSSFSWEEVDCVDKSGVWKPDKKVTTDIDGECSTAASEEEDNSVPGHSLSALSKKTQNLSLEEGQGHPLNHSSFDLTRPVAGKEKRNTHSQVEPGPSLDDAIASQASMVPHPSQSGGAVDATSQSSQSESFEMIDPSAETESVTDCNRGLDVVYPQRMMQGEDDGKGLGMLVSDKATYFEVDPEGETVDGTDEIPRSNDAAENIVVLPKQTSQDTKMCLDDIDPGAETADGWEVVESNGVSATKHPSHTDAAHRQKSTTTGNSSTSALERMSSAGSSFDPCDSTETGDDDYLNCVLSSSHSSISSFKSGGRSSRSLSSMSDQGSLNSSTSSFVMVKGKTREEILEARTLEEADYQKLLSGVGHDWLLQRLNGTGIFKPNRLHKAYTALLLKYSKKSGLWTAQETIVHIGDRLRVDKPGKQRNAFWIHCLHQDETLGRYVGKEYKEEKELFYHINDVERQMTAQYYVTEFNRRLFELRIPTQIFYLPSAVLMILEGRSIKGCVSVEPYILGDFVKLSNNKDVVRSQYKATEYGLAFGHFTYEFTNKSDIVVDLQGWVTGSEKGEALIYLTDPQIHSLKLKAVKNNFGKEGEKYFFVNQHQECNEICSRLSLKRPSFPNNK